MGAQILNLSPKSTASQYLGKANVTKMMHMAFKVARAQSPSILFIEDVEMVFAKKVPKDDTSDPKRIKKDLLKNIKLIKDPEERVLIIGTSNKPWDSDTKALQSMFDKIIYCPKPDYSSRLYLWKAYVTELSGDRARYLNFTLLARSSDGISAGEIYTVCNRVLSDRRLKKVLQY